jgi:hypothetical protein
MPPTRTAPTTASYAWVNDKINGRIARIRLDYFECDKITEIPNVQGFHGIFPDKRDPVDQAINYTTRVFCGGEFHIPLPNDGKRHGRPEQVPLAVHLRGRRDHGSALAVLIDGNWTWSPPRTTASWPPPTSTTPRWAPLRRHDVRREGRLRVLQRCPHREGRQGRQVQDHRHSKVPVVDGTKEANKDPKTALTAYVPVPKNPHGVNASPDGKYFICAGKLSPTGTVIELAKVLKTSSTASSEKLDKTPSSPKSKSAWAPAHRLRRPRQRLHHAVPGQPDRQVERRCRHQVPQGRQERQVRGGPHRRALPAGPHQRRHVAKPRKPTASSWRWVASSPRTASCPLARCTRKTSS